MKISRRPLLAQLFLADAVQVRIGSQQELISADGGTGVHESLVGLNHVDGEFFVFGFGRKDDNPLVSRCDVELVARTDN